MGILHERRRGEQIEAGLTSLAGLVIALVGYQFAVVEAPDCLALCKTTILNTIGAYLIIGGLVTAVLAPCVLLVRNLLSHSKRRRTGS